MLKTLCVILCLLGPYNLLAQEQFYGSFFVGIGDTFGLDTEKNVELTVGGRGGLLFYERLEVGLYYNYYQSQEDSVRV